eukprot:PhF_6_TR8875/c0_g1_i1/m.14043
MLRRSLVTCMYGKPSTEPSKRTRHHAKWWMQAHARKLTYRNMKELYIAPAIQPVNEEVYGMPMLPKEGNCCLQCKQTVDVTAIQNYVWVPAGRAKLPTPQGYLFHRLCFRCPECKYRFYNNKFGTKNGQAVCLFCMRGITNGRPIRRWHLPMVQPGREGSKFVGEIFPRNPTDEEWLFNPET